MHAMGQLRDTIGTPVSTAEQADHDRCLETIRANLDEAVFAAHWAHGETMTMEEAVGYALNAS